MTDRRLEHAAAHWCLQHTGPKLGTPAICDLAEKLGLQIDLAPQADWPLIYERGLKVSSVMADMGDFKPYQAGFANPAQWDYVAPRLTAMINAAADQGIKRVLVFTGYKTPGISRQQAFANVVDGFTRHVLGLAEQRDVILCLEMLNSIEADEQMQGHPLYLADRTTEALVTVMNLKSKHFKLAFDVYHQAVMGEDSLAKVEQCKGHIGLVHTAGFRLSDNRCELHAENQTIQYRPIMDAIVASGYNGPVCHEFIYRLPDHEASLTAAIALCEAAV
jgi:hydroxypyruvate isomerase